MNESSRKPTLEDVARHAGVSRALASIVLRNAPGASDDSRRRIRRVMAELGYRPDRRASQLAASRTRVVGVQFTLESEFHGRLLRHLYDEAARSNYELLLSGVTGEHDDGDAVATLQEARPDGLILIDPGEIGAIATDEPLVVIGHSGPPDADRVFTSSNSGVRLALDHLVALGHQDICHVSVTDHPVGKERLDAYLTYMHDRGLPTAVRRSVSDSVEGGAAIARDLCQTDLPTAVLAYNDEIAVGLAVELMRAGVRVPEDVSVVGFDDIGRLAAGLGLTTVSQHMDRLAETSLQLVIDRIDGGGTSGRHRRQTVIEPSLRVRTSTAPPR